MQFIKENKNDLTAAHVRPIRQAVKILPPPRHHHCQPTPSLPLLLHAMADKPPERLAVPSRNPLPLSASQESQVRDIFYANVRKECAEEIKGASSISSPSSPQRLCLSSLSAAIFAVVRSLTLAAFAACALGRTFTVSFACRAPHRVMNNCMKLHATQEAHDDAREEWFAMRMERHRQREHRAKVAVAQEEFLREWWGLPEHVRFSKQRDLDRLGIEERVGGMAAKDRPQR